MNRYLDLENGLAGNLANRVLMTGSRAGIRLLHGGLHLAALVLLLVVSLPGPLAAQRGEGRQDESSAEVAARRLIGVYYGNADVGGHFAAVQLHQPVQESLYVFALGTRQFGEKGSDGSAEIGVGIVSRGFFSLQHHVQIGLRAVDRAEGSEADHPVTGVVQVGFELPRGRVRPYVAGRGLLFESGGAEVLIGLNLIL